MEIDHEKERKKKDLQWTFSSAREAFMETKEEEGVFFFFVTMVVNWAG
jgi:hypothetical protein